MYLGICDGSFYVAFILTNTGVNGAENTPRVIGCPLGRVPDTGAPGSCGAPRNQSPPPNSPACPALLPSFRFKPQGQARTAEPKRKGLRMAAATESHPQMTRGATGLTPRVASARLRHALPTPAPTTTDRTSAGG